MLDNTEETVRESTKAYMAGLMDAEGCFTITATKRSYGNLNFQNGLTLINTYQPLRKWLVHNFGGVCKGHRVQKSHYRERFDWRLQSYEHSLRFLTLIRPYLQVKGKEADILMEFYRIGKVHNVQLRTELHDKIRELKDRSSVTTESPKFSTNNLANAYLAGFFDGEGCISMSRPHFSLRLIVNNTARNVIEEMHRRYTGHFSCLKNRNINWNPCWHWETGDQRKIENILLGWLPYLIVKRDQALVGLEVARMWHQKNTARREELYNKMRDLNGENKIQSELPSDRKNDAVEIQQSQTQ